MSKLKKIIFSIGAIATILITSSNTANAFTNKSYNISLVHGNQRASLTVCNGYAHAGTYQNFSDGYVSTTVLSGGKKYFKEGKRNASIGYVYGSYWGVSHTMIGGGWSNYHFS